MKRSLLDDFFYHLTMGNFFKPEPEKLTPFMQASAELEKAQFDLLEHTKLSEYHAAMVTMLTKRVTRLRADTERLSATPSTTSMEKT